VNFVGVVGVDSSGKLGTFSVDANGNRVPLSSLQGNPQAVPESQAAQPQKQAMLNLKVEKLQATVAQQQKQIGSLMAQLKEQAAQIQKVSAQVEMSKPAAKVVNNNE
jgi:septal ring factor EnvC (AmiA/AmiB activator)